MSREAASSVSVNITAQCREPAWAGKDAGVKAALPRAIRGGLKACELLAVALLLPGLAWGLEDDPFGNWFNDPFFQVRAGRADCPPPRGPLLHRSQISAEEHSRVERGTSCWLAGQCDKPNAYLYDASIAQGLQERFARSAAFATSALWVTVKRRFVWIEGCADDANVAPALEALARSVPHVELVLVNLRTSASGRIPYDILDGAAGQP
jgi:hypothetical protein